MHQAIFYFRMHENNYIFSQFR